MLKDSAQLTHNQHTHTHKADQEEKNDFMEINERDREAKTKQKTTFNKKCKRDKPCK